MKKKCLQIAIFTDGRPGHEKQTLGVVQALEKLTEIATINFTVPKKSYWNQLTGVYRYLFGCDESVYGKLKDCDVLIGTGSATHLPMLSCRARYHIPVVTCMTPSQLLLRSFELCCVPQHDSVKKHSNIFRTIGPPNAEIEFKNQNKDKSLILIGGINTRSHDWRSGDLEDQILKLISAKGETEWTISTSPRTPSTTSHRIRDLSARHTNVTFFPFEETPPGWVEKEYSRNKNVWVTADSMSMVYEALSAGCNVGLLPICWKKKENKFIRSERYLREQNLIVTFEQWLNGYREWPNTKPINEAKRCAEHILKTLKRGS